MATKGKPRKGQRSRTPRPPTMVRPGTPVQVADVGASILVMPVGDTPQREAAEARVWLEELHDLTGYALRAWDDMLDAAERERPRETFLAWQALGTFLSATASISKAFDGTMRRTAEAQRLATARVAMLRRVLGPPVDDPAWNRDARNGTEHYDEYLDQALAERERGVYLPRSICRVGMRQWVAQPSGDEPALPLRQLETDTLHAQIGHKRTDLGALVQAVQRLRARCQEIWPTLETVGGIGPGTIHLSTELMEQYAREGRFTTAGRLQRPPRIVPRDVHLPLAEVVRTARPT